jgi:hypothetical protein
MKDKGLRHKDVWTGEYRRINFEINKFYFSNGKEQWTFYLILRLSLLPPKIKDRFWLKPYKYGAGKKRNHIGYHYSQEPLINNIEWHYGCTWYSKIAGFDGGEKVVKIGCDYGHYWDDEYIYDEQIVLNDVKVAIDSLHKLIPNIRYWCSYCGKKGLRGYHKIREDSFYCKKCFKEHKKQKDTPNET